MSKKICCRLIKGIAINTVFGLLLGTIAALVIIDIFNVELKNISLMFFLSDVFFIGVLSILGFGLEVVDREL